MDRATGTKITRWSGSPVIGLSMVTIGFTGIMSEANIVTIGIVILAIITTTIIANIEPGRLHNWGSGGFRTAAYSSGSGDLQTPQVLINCPTFGNRSVAAWIIITANKFFVRAHTTPNEMPPTDNTTIE